MNSTFLTEVVQANLAKYKAFDKAVGEIIAKLAETDEPIIVIPFLTVEGCVGIAIDENNSGACQMNEQGLSGDFVQFVVEANRLGMNNPELVMLKEDEFNGLKYCGKPEEVARAIFFRAITDFPDDMVVVSRLAEFVREAREAKKAG